MQWLQWLLDFWCLLLGHLWGWGQDREQQETLFCLTFLVKTAWKLRKRKTDKTLTDLFVRLTKSGGRREELRFIVLCFWKEAALLYVTSQRRDINNNAFKPWQLIFKCRPAARLWQYTGDDDKRNLKKWKICILWIIWTFEDIVCFFFGF